MINKLSDLVESEKKKQQEELIRQNNAKKQKIINIARWVFAVFLILVAIGSFPSFTSIIMVVVALLAAPISQIQNMIPLKGIAKGGIAALLFIVGAAIAPEQKTNDNVADEGKTSEVVTVDEDENKPSDTLVVEDNKNNTTNEVATSGEAEVIEEDTTLSNEIESTDDSVLVSESTDDTEVEEVAPVLESVALYVNGASAPSGTWILTVGKDYTTYFDKTPADMAVESVAYRSTDENIAKVDSNGKISALAVGTATVYVNVDGVEDYVSLKVNEVQQSNVGGTTGGSGAGTTGSTSAEVRAYVLNSSNHKFHKPSCSKLPTKNRVDVESTRDDLIAQGYEPCKICNP